MDCRKTRGLDRLTVADAADVAKALGHPVRIKILTLLLELGECYCGELSEEVQLAQSTVSQHLKVLRDAGLVRSVACGRAVGSSVDRSRLQQFAAWLQTTIVNTRQDAVR